MAIKNRQVRIKVIPSPNQVTATNHHIQDKAIFATDTEDAVVGLALAQDDFARLYTTA